MATRARIGIANGDGTVTSIYTHYDGYVAGHGPILLGQYADESKLRALLALGNLSLLGSEIGEAHDFDARRSWEDEDPRQAWCLAYGRDRGETDTEARTHAIDGEWPDAGQEFEYLYVPAVARWRVRERLTSTWTWGEWQDLFALTSREVAAMKARIAARAAQVAK